jgi:hypothetical protein
MNRWESTRGNNARNRKIDEATAQAILNAKQPGMSVADACDLFDGATPSIVGDIWRRRTWKHLKQEQQHAANA